MKPWIKPSVTWLALWSTLLAWCYCIGLRHAQGAPPTCNVGCACANPYGYNTWDNGANAGTAFYYQRSAGGVPTLTTQANTQLVANTTQCSTGIRTQTVQSLYDYSDSWPDACFVGNPHPDGYYLASPPGTINFPKTDGQPQTRYVCAP